MQVHSFQPHPSNATLPRGGTARSDPAHCGKLARSGSERLTHDFHTSWYARSAARRWRKREARSALRARAGASLGLRTRSRIYFIISLIQHRLHYFVSTVFHYFVHSIYISPIQLYCIIHSTTNPTVTAHFLNIYSYEIEVRNLGTRPVIQYSTTIQPRLILAPPNIVHRFFAILHGTRVLNKIRGTKPN